MNTIPNLVHMYRSIKSLEDKQVQTDQIGVKDLRIIKVTQKFHDSFSNSNTYKCLLTFKDGVKISCQLPGSTIVDISKNKVFRDNRGKLDGMGPYECLLNQSTNIKPGCVPFEFSNYDKLIEDLYHSSSEKEK